MPTDFSSEYDDSEDLHINRRSTKLVIDFNNEFFKQILDYYAKNRVSFKKLQTTYGKLHQDYPAYSDEAKEAARIKGFVKLNLVYGTPTKSSGPLPYLKGSDGQPYYGKEGVLKHLPEYILEQHNKYNYPFGKILILVNRNKEGDEVVNAILEHNKAYPDRLINIVSAESLLLQNSAAVRMVISVLYFINSTQHAHSDEDEDIDTGKPTMQKLMQKRLKDQLYYKNAARLRSGVGQGWGKCRCRRTDGKRCSATTTTLRQKNRWRNRWKSSPTNSRTCYPTQRTSKRASWAWWIKSSRNIWSRLGSTRVPRPHSSWHFKAWCSTSARSAPMAAPFMSF
ncbi:MAG: hypothetical protein L6U16_12460 [Porphyromonadaceae bacterium]|nr:MAG: hypothetical protein L6U16_12460 [Porphyromonadaceae bacterium]